MTEKHESDVTCTDCYTLLTKICTKIDMMRGDTMKVIFALLGLVAANFGLKYLGTPWYMYLAVGLSIMSGVFLFAVSFCSWGRIGKVWTALGFLISFRMELEAVLRIWHYHNHMPLPQSWGIPVQLIQAAIAFLLIVAFWRHERWDGEDRRRNNL